MGCFMFGSLKPESFLIYSELESGHASFQHVDPHEKQWEPGIKPKESTWKRHLEQRRKRTNAFFIYRVYIQFPPCIKIYSIDRILYRWLGFFSINVVSYLLHLISMSVSTNSRGTDFHKSCSIFFSITPLMKINSHVPSTRLLYSLSVRKVTNK